MIGDIKSISNNRITLRTSAKKYIGLSRNKRIREHIESVRFIPSTDISSKSFGYFRIRFKHKTRKKDLLNKENF